MSNLKIDYKAVAYFFIGAVVGCSIHEVPGLVARFVA